MNGAAVSAPASVGQRRTALQAVAESGHISIVEWPREGH